MGGASASPIQEAAARDQQSLNREQVGLMREKNAREAAQFAKVEPFLTDRLHNGLPFFNALTDAQAGTLARAYQPVYNRAAKQMGSFGVPNGTNDAVIRSIDADKARAFDDKLTNSLLMNEQAKKDAAAGLTGQQQIALNAAQGNAGIATQGNNAIFSSQALMNQGSPLGGILGGIAGSALGGLMGNPKLPF